jgi:uncharacterized protein YdiU (UPF0061 family)
VAELFKDAAGFTEWAQRWRARLEEEGGDPKQRREAMRRTNPAYIPRNHLVEEAISAAVGRQDFQPFEDLLRVLSRPFEEQAGRERFSLPPKPEEVVRQTFCGT